MKINIVVYLTFIVISLIMALYFLISGVAAPGWFLIWMIFMIIVIILRWIGVIKIW
jgi:hypothetical protein